MKRTLVAAVAAGLLLGGCATGDTGHLDPEISPDLIGPRSTPDADAASGSSDDESDEQDAVQTPAPGSSGAAGSEVEEAFAAAYGEEPWYDDVRGVDPSDDTVIVTTGLRPGDPAAVDVCEAAFDVAEQSGIASPTVLVRDVEGETIAERDAAAGDEGCSS